VRRSRGRSLIDRHGASHERACPSPGVVCGAPVGFVNYHHREDWNRRLELGFMLGRPFWGRGLMAEALAALIHHSLGGLGMIRIEATVQPDNLRATALLAASASVSKADRCAGGCASAARRAT
jgi:RimJ/RimL family protein N-acetyltransferase